jgi:transcriptional regulator with XRE-family HTH domain
MESPHTKESRTMNAGLALRERRRALLLGLEQMSAAMGHTPRPSVLSRIETGATHPNRAMSERLAEALDLPKETVLNVFGYTTDEQMQEALVHLCNIVQERWEMVPVYTPDGVARTRRNVLVRWPEPAFVLRDGDTEILAIERDPEPGETAILKIGRELSAWTRDSRGFVNAQGERAPDNAKVEGTVVRVSHEM